MSDYHIIGVDLGFSGGLSMWTLKGNLIAWQEMPTYKDNKGYVQIDTGRLHQLLKDCPDTLVIMERAFSKGNGALRYGEGVGKVKAVCEINDIDTYIIEATDWHKYSGMTGLTRPQRKRRAMDIASEITGETITKDGIADAILIGRYGVALTMDAFDRMLRGE